MNDKWGRRLFKTGACFLILMGLVHSVSLFEKLAPANDTERVLIGLMDSYKFNLMGSQRSVSDLFNGFSISFMVASLGFGVFDIFLWAERSSLLKRVALANILWLAVMVGVSLHYFFAAPSSFLIVALLIFIFAWMKLPVEKVS
ncbi:MAG TPA: hypothetical protein VGF44_01850 [Terriglobales bacterium]